MNFSIKDFFSKCDKIRRKLSNNHFSNLAVQPGNERRSYHYAAQPEFYNWNYFTAVGTTGRYQLFDNKTESIFLDGTLEEATFIKVKKIIIFGDNLV